MTQKLKDMILMARENNRSADANLYNKGVIYYHPEIGKPVYLQIATNDHELNIYAYPMDMAVNKNKYKANEDAFLESLQAEICAKFDSIMVNDEPTAILNSHYICRKNADERYLMSYACIDEISVKDSDFYRKKLGTSLRRYAEEIFHENGLESMYALRDEQSIEELRTKQNFIEKFFRKDGYLKFLAANGFVVDDNNYQLPIKNRICSKGLLSPKLHKLGIDQSENDFDLQIISKSMGLDELGEEQQR